MTGEKYLKLDDFILSKVFVKNLILKMIIINKTY